ncbi:DUF72 domain-containing protein [Mucilaginibacter sp. PAMB04168]|uniref:DUF72 domain-containing protein n=1 Tax=Mucilaginibacter sp. PAMB04168 TaxID=3138567 RepID=UPI0031F64558
MEFGKVILPELDLIDFTLPPDAALTTATLREAKGKQPLRVYVGCSSWGQKDWKGMMFPAKTKSADFLQEYVKHFNMIELNATHYRMHDAVTIAKWKEKAASNPDFKFCPKFNQLITHIKRLKQADEITTSFYESMLAFEDKLGPMFLQMSDGYLPQHFAEFKSYIESLPRDLPVFAELRHKDWFANTIHYNAAFELMNKLNIGSIITDTAGRRDVVHMTLTTPVAFIRFVGNALHPTDYLRIDAWVNRFAQWSKQGLQAIYFGMHQPDEKTTPLLCDYLIMQLNKTLHMNIARPGLLPTNNTLF